MYIKIYNIWDHRAGAHTSEEFTVCLHIDNDREIKEQLNDYLLDHKKHKPEWFDWDIIETAEDTEKYLKMVTKGTTK